jgi:uncharacterized sporulation protein YeaH/YhbH (DUF444 family)
MTHFIDRRLNPRDKSLGNRRRFLGRVREAVKAAVDEAVRGRGIADMGQGGKVSVPARGVAEPSFRHADRGGARESVLPGNRDFRTGDRIEKPKGGAGAGGRQGSADGEGADEFAFTLSREEFLDIFFEDLDLPDLVKRSLGEAGVTRPGRAGFAVSGTPANISIARTMRNALGRRRALGRPGTGEVAALRARIGEIEAGEAGATSEAGEIGALRLRLEGLERRRRAIPFLDPIDLRYARFEPRPVPTARAVMVCLMDVSASMGEREKDLAKRFFVLLHLFLRRRYEQVDLVFIRHTHLAGEVDEEAFFHSRETGGTVVSTALTEMGRVIAARYPAGEWNIYAAQASDGENMPGDSARCAALLDGGLLKLCQYFAYVEIGPDGGDGPALPFRAGELWQTYAALGERWPRLAMQRIARRADIYPVFRELFRREPEGAAHA